MDVTSRESVSGLCDFCIISICRSNRTWDFHHPHSELLQISASKGCLFCCTLLNDLHDSELNLLPWPLYRWNLRVAKPTRESREIVLLTFRPIPAPTSHVSHLVVDSLPDRVFYFYQEQDLGRIPSLKDIGDSTNDPSTWNQIQQWLEVCNESHQRCGHRRKKPDSVPMRLLDVKEITSSPDPFARIRVVSTAANKIHEPYVTLSHRWADNADFLQLTKANLNVMAITGFAWSDPLLPQTFKDAILLARAMGIAYIWIDSLCIIQERSPHWNDQGNTAPETETQKESKLMHIYYTNSFCNISTADSGNGLPGLFRSRTLAGKDPSNVPIIPPRISFDKDNLVFGSKTWRIVADSLWESQLLSNKLYTRAWVFQERMLSPRMLHFSKDQVFWECSTISACEGLPDGIPALSNITAVRDRHWRSRLQAGFSLHQRPLAGEDDESMDTLWKNAVREYTRCQLSEDGDKLIAIWSIAKLVRDALDEDYQAGLWSGDLEEQLAWRVVNCRQVDGSPSARIDPTSTPSWSWASLNGMIEPCDRSRGSGTLERVYRVVNHRGLRIRFNKELGRSKSEPIDLPRLSTFVARGPQAPIKPQKDMKALKESSDQPPTFKDASIAISGYLREGQLSFNEETERWELAPLPNTSLYPSEGAMEQQVEEAGTAGDKDVIRLTEVFPDIDPGHKLAKPSCWLVVLAYSRNSGAVPTFSGIGLMLHGVRDSYFVRSGAFHFDEINETALKCFTAVPLEQGVKIAPTMSDMSHKQPAAIQANNFWLI